MHSQRTQCRERFKKRRRHVTGLGHEYNLTLMACIKGVNGERRYSRVFIGRRSRIDIAISEGSLALKHVRKLIDLAWLTALYFA